MKKKKIDWIQIRKKMDDSFPKIALLIMTILICILFGCIIWAILLRNLALLLFQIICFICSVIQTMNMFIDIKVDEQKENEKKVGNNENG